MYNDWRNLLVACGGGIADLVEVEPAIRALRDALPESSVTLLTSPVGKQASSLIRGIDQVLVRRELSADLVYTLRSLDLDAAILFTRYGDSPYALAYACYLAGIPVRVGQSAEFGGTVLSQWIKPARRRKEPWRRHLSMLRAIGLDAPDRRPELSAVACRNALQLLHDLGSYKGQPFVLTVTSACSSDERVLPARCQLTASSNGQLSLAVRIVRGAWPSSALAPFKRQAAVSRAPVVGIVGLVLLAEAVVTDDPEFVRIGRALRRPVQYLSPATTPVTAPAVQEQELAWID